jgi:hypothetical protein
LTEKIVSLEIENAFEELKALLLKRGCRIIAEEPPARISVKQGSIWGISPTSAKKVMIYNLSPVASGTRISCSSSFASDWKNLTIIGSALSIIVAGLCLWIAIDLEAFTVTQTPSYWSWLASAGGYVNIQLVQAFAGLARALAVFLVIMMVLEVAIVVYVRSKINGFAQETLNLLH